ncbi:MAG: hypothetical protein JWP41_2560 [Ramlibacter sp.]|nr:hypothetical protein [Ramlibacter sp.]
MKVNRAERCKGSRRRTDALVEFGRAEIVSPGFAVANSALGLTPEPGAQEGGYMKTAAAVPPATKTVAGALIPAWAFEAGYLSSRF